MASRHEITSIQFKADAGKANAAIDSIRQEAAQAADKVKELRRRLEEGKKANLPVEDIKALEKELERAEKPAKQWNNALSNLTKGVKALDQAIIAFNNGKGSVEGMSAALSKAARNAAQLQQSRVDKSNPTWHEMEALILALDKNLLKARQDVDGLIASLSQGDRVSSGELRTATITLRELMDVTAQGTAEWKQYQSQLQSIEKYVATLSETERRLAGEVVTVEDAMKRANTASREEAEIRAERARQDHQQAVLDRERAESAARLAHMNTEYIERELTASKEILETKKKELSAVDEEIAKNKELESSIKQGAKLRMDLAKAQDETSAKRGAIFTEKKEWSKLNDDVVKATVKVQELQEKIANLSKGEGSGKPNPALEQLKRDIESATNELATLEQQWQEKIINYTYEKYPTQATVSAKTKSPEGLKEREAMQQDPVLAQMREQSKKEIDAADEKLSLLIRKERELTEATQEQSKTTAESAETDKQKLELQKQLADAESSLTQAKEKADAQNRKVADAEKARNDALDKEKAIQEELNKLVNGRNFEEEEKKLNDLKDKHDDLSESIEAEQKRHDELTGSLQKQKEAEEELSANAVDTLRKEQEAAIEMAQAQNQSQEAVEQSIAVLEKAHRKTNDGTTEYTQQAEAIAKLKQRLAEMRGEAMSLADAEALAATAGKEGFKGTAQQLQMAEQALQRALQTAEKGTPEWDRYRKALERIRTEMQNMGMSSERMHAILDNPAADRNLNELKEAVKRAKAELALMEGTVDKNSKKFAELAKQTKNAEMRQKELEAQSKGTATAFEKAWSRLKTYVGAAMAMQKVVATMGDLMELSDKMGEVRKTTGFTADEVGRLSENLKRMDTRTTLVDLLGIAAEAGTLGLKTQQDIQGFTEAANMLMVSLPEMGQEAAKQLMKIANATGDLKRNGGDVEETMQRVGSTIIALRANSASAAPQITDFVSRVGAVGAQAGISIDQIAALGSTIDALGGRVEMSATALSRMIPAIRNNAFGVANAIGVTEKTLKDLFDQGRAMEAMVLIFRKMRESVQGFDTSTEEGTAAMAKNVEDLLGRNAAMADVMKELNQQGARAGIVFGLLSQNVDELERQLGIAGDAYKQNTALLNEYNNMNETTAAKWARLKNQLEEFFVGDSSQRFLGGIITVLRALVDLLTGNVSPALKIVTDLLHVFITYWSVLKLGLGEGIFVKAIAGLKAMGSGLWNLIGNTTAYISYSRKLAVAQAEVKMATTAATKALAQQKVAAIEAEMAQKGLNKAMIANVWMALAAAIGAVIFKIYEYATKADELAEAFWHLQEEEEAAERDINRLTTSLTKATATVADTTKKHDELEEQTETLRKEVDELNKSTNLSSEAQKTLQEKTDALKKSEDDLKAATDEMNKAKKEHSGLITEINSKYSTYLGYMLSEVTNADLVASAHRRIVAALREELEQKRLLENEKAIEKKYSKDIEEYTKDSRDELSGLPRDVQDMIMRRRSNMMAQVSYDFEEKTRADGTKYKEGRFIVPTIDGIGNAERTFTNEKDARNYLRTLLGTIVKQETLDKGVGLGTKTEIKQTYNQQTLQWERKTVTKQRTLADYMNDIWGGGLDDGFGDLIKTELKRSEDLARQRYQDEGAIEGATAQANKATLEDIKKNADSIATTIKDNKTLTDQQINELGRQLNAVVQSSMKYGGSPSDVSVYFGGNGNFTNDNAAQKLLSGLDEATRKKVLAVASQNAKLGTGGTTSPTTLTSTNPYGQYNPVTSPYSDWNADDLVKRRKEMLERVRTLAAGADVQAVLSEDAAFITKATRDNIKTTQQAIEWYNTERLKIQDALHEKHLTNTGDWMDPKKGGKRASKLVQDEMKYYLDELDAYYTERKAEIQEALNDEQISEAEARNRTLAIEAEWYQRRGNLQKLYSKERKEVAQQESNAIYDILSDRTGDTTDYIKADIASTVKFIEKVGAEKGKPAMDKIYGDIDLGMEKSFLRSRNAIGKHMQDITNIVNKENPFNGIAEGLRKNLGTMDLLLTDITDDAQRTADREVERTMFLLEQSTKGYALTWQQLMGEMAKRGWEAWGKAIDADTQMQSRLMHQVYQVFEKVQDAIKKEASELKKQADIMWSNLLMPGGDGKTTVKDVFEQAVGRLGIEQGRVSRANSLIGAGQASERVADRLAIKQMEVQLAMQQYQYALTKKIANEKINSLREEAKLEESLGHAEKARSLRMQADNAQQALNLATKKEQTDELKLQEDIIARTEESQARLYKELREWGDLIASSLQSVFEASNTGQADFYNEMAKLRLTGDTGGGTYVVIDNAGTSKAEAHYETYATEEEHLRRQLEIDQQNAVAEAWKKVMDDINTKMNDMITDQLNAMLQNASTDANTKVVELNTEAERLNTEATQSLSAQMALLAEAFRESTGGGETGSDGSTGEGKSGSDGSTGEGESGSDELSPGAQKEIDESNKITETKLENDEKQKESEKKKNKKIQTSSQSTFAKMTLAANMYGAAYQAMSNDNLSTTQKFEMMALQAVGNYAVGALTTEMAAASAKAAADSPGVLGTLWKQLGWAAAPVFAIFTGLLGGLMGLATSKISKAKSTIAQATGASGASAGRLSTGMLTYAEGNVNEFTDPATLTPGRQYNVDAADGRTYRARYMGSNPRTHLTNGPEFHLSGERGREMIIDAGTTRQITMDESGIWHAIQTLSGGGSLTALRRTTRRGRGIRAFADGNVSDFSDYSDYSDYSETSDMGMSMEMAASLQASIDRQSDLLERALTDGIKAVNKWTGADGIPNMYNKMQKEAKRHGVNYL